MFHLGSFESSLRNSDGGKKYAARKRKEAKLKFVDIHNNNNNNNKHKSLNGKVCGADRSMKDVDLSCKRKYSSDQCVPKSDESLTDSAVEVDHKVSGSSQETSVDGSIGLSESDNEKLKSSDCVNCEGMRRKHRDGDNGITSADGACEQWVEPGRKRSWSAGVDVMGPKRVLKIRGPFGSLVDLSNPEERHPFGSPIEKCQSEPFSVVNLGVTVTSKNTSEAVMTVTEEEKLLQAIETLSKKFKDDGESFDAFEDLDVEKFENARVSKLFETYFKDVKTKDRKDWKGTIENLLDTLKDFDSSKRVTVTRETQKLSKLSSKEKKRYLRELDAYRNCKSGAKDEEIIKNILPNKKELLAMNKAKKATENEKKMQSTGTTRRSVLVTSTSSMETVKPNLKNTVMSNSCTKSEGKPNVGKSDSDRKRSSIQDKTKKTKRESFFASNGAQSLTTKKENDDSKHSKQKTDVTGRRTPKHENLSKPADSGRKSLSNGTSNLQRSSSGRKDRVAKAQEGELSIQEKNARNIQLGKGDQDEALVRKNCAQVVEKSLREQPEMTTLTNGKIRLGSPLPILETLYKRNEPLVGNVKKLISNFETNRSRQDQSGLEVSPTAKFGSIKPETPKKLEDAKKVRDLVCTEEIYEKVRCPVMANVNQIERARET
ncbi:hypothetical protein RUM43_011274 [Polyplax serrata]|uniref:Uncharacterized protein n=1 Tax=Polyplax serrata TaxID=468196 RepID=A0AAN8S7T2_POLSC